MEEVYMGKNKSKRYNTNEIGKNLALEQVCPAQLDLVAWLDEESELVP